MAVKAVIKNRALYEAPVGTEPPPFWIRSLLVLTCTGVSFAHGSNDGQKGMGLIMLILVGTVPTAYALNHAVTRKQSDDFVAVSQQAATVLSKYVRSNAVVGDDREELTDYIRTKEFTPNTMLALRQLVSDIGNETVLFGELAKVPNDRVRNFRNDMYVVSEALRLMKKNQPNLINAADWEALNNYKKHVDRATTLYSRMGESCRRPGSRPRNHGGLEAHRGHSWRKNRQGPFDLRTGGGGRNYGHVHNRRRRLVRPAGQHYPRAFFWSGGNYGRESLRPAMGHRA